MKIGLIGCGTVGGTLKRWLEEHTKHELAKHDPAKGFNDSLENCDAIFISVPVPHNETGQDQEVLRDCVNLAKKHSNNVFIRSTVLPKTNDELGTISMPEFLTERFAYEDMCKYPVLSGYCDIDLLNLIFPNKEIIMMHNTEAELAKYAHNCFGAMKVTYFNIINELCESMGIKYDRVLKASMITGFIEKQHTKIAQDGLKGYAGSCFPTNVESFRAWLLNNGKDESQFFRVISQLNKKYRTPLNLEVVNDAYVGES